MDAKEALVSMLLQKYRGSSRKSCRLSWTLAHILVRKCEKVWNNSLGERRKEERKRRSLTAGALEVSRCSPELVDEDWLSLCQGPFEGIDAVEWSEVFATLKRLVEKAARLNVATRSQCCGRWRLGKTVAIGSVQRREASTMPGGNCRYWFMGEFMDLLVTYMTHSEPLRLSRSDLLQSLPCISASWLRSPFQDDRLELSKSHARIFLLEGCRTLNKGDDWMTLFNFSHPEMLEEFRTAVQTLRSLQFLLKRSTREVRWTPLLAGARQQISRGRWAAEKRVTRYESKKHLVGSTALEGHSRRRANPTSETRCLGEWRPEPCQHQNDGVVLQICLVGAGKWPGPRQSSVVKFAWRGTQRHCLRQNIRKLLGVGNARILGSVVADAFSTLCRI